MRRVSTLLKHQQLKGAQALLEYCQTTSTRRIEWELTDVTKIEESEQADFLMGITLYYLTKKQAIN